MRYKYYRYACGRDARLEKVWSPRAVQRLIRELGVADWFATHDTAEDHG